MRRLLVEICELPARQRSALLLNLKDSQGVDCISLFLLSGIATPREIAQIVGVSAEEFAEMWNKLPLDDNTTANRLGITRQQVINSA
jgi:hypothetical protein